jgi:(4-(4-[2-(gamma-L-glutamylamino)ethyl]phenoxymethyl)furan-2-yl)methanamine synthase
MNHNIIGWDIGGAHIKAVVLNRQGLIVLAQQRPCPLWKGIDYLHRSVAELLPLLPRNAVHALTMTGELVDCFATREQGVADILAAMRQLLPQARIQVYVGRQGFRPLADITGAHAADIASANWLATAQWLAQHGETALLVDIGSTTTDILYIADQRVLAQGYSDYQRLVSGELFYSGVVRTAVMAVAQQAQFNGHSMGLMTEYFATMADVYRLTGDLQPQHDQADTADGQPKTAEASARRLSRMTGYEFDARQWPLWLEFAEYLKQTQMQQIGNACRNIHATPPLLIGAGVGRFLVQQLAASLPTAYRDMAELLPAQDATTALAAADCAPAAAVACLLNMGCRRDLS